jgi:predicted nuclease of predicted toxin-antitoxin system
VRFLIDVCVGRRLADWLRRSGHDVVESRERGRDPGDRELLRWAPAEDRILLTMDKDVGEFIFRESVQHHGLIRLRDVPAERRILLVERLLVDHARELSERAVVTIRGGRIRISRSMP